MISAPDAESIYEVPLILQREGLDSYLVHLLRLPEDVVPIGPVMLASPLNRRRKRCLSSWSTREAPGSSTKRSSAK